ncbi:putative inorganic phosphate cotransporter isoform X2 [Diorhabda carinulata]|uniref:putative inorganic phosphate cotransporter isoform X2 n=1 Tax=Diorhabda sublineata TaxID=1163346 RepID=UPI0024E0887D|nr:putative inorganic phosphate cotransporter isoform X2 [Diorhabda sublineata]XP_057669842.1 putative inorganic phosphate cotransporter isoform X2 [Diorhabda carinulata]
MVVAKENFFGKRHVQYLLLFSVNVLAYGLRNILNLAVIAMISTSPPEGVKTFPEWSESKNVMLSSFFWGYVLTQIPAGQLAERFGPKLFLSGAIIICSLFSILIPIFGAYFGYIGVMVCRIIQGLMQGFIYPSIHHLISAWVPLSSRAKIAGFVYAGGPLGTVIVMPIVGYISGSKLGWQTVFYLLGGIGFTWTACWMFFGLDSPHHHKTISPEELKFIQDGVVSNKKKEQLPTPWRDILTSVPFWAILICHFGDLWGFWTLLTEIPTYMDKILKFDIASNSTLSALPYLIYCLLNLVMSPIADYLITNKITSVGASRKIFNSIGVFIPGIALIVLCFIGSEERALTVFMLVVAVGVNTAILIGFHVNHIDIAPNHAGTLMGITNAIGNVAAILAPLAVDLFKKVGGYEESDKQLWNIVFITASVLFITTGIFYAVGASGEVQKWNDKRPKQEENVPEKEPMYQNGT